METPAPLRDNVSVTATTQRRPAVVERIILRTRGTLTERDPLLALDELQALRAELDAYENELVGRALGSGATLRRRRPLAADLAPGGAPPLPR